ncbi:methyltransferase domain-containing protein [Streptomyces ipomoeae]|uniref:methyltransferase domain-containing protein n=1 Tax=Streptomyces ipomoeae TaxID=103232 RepID=UPI0015F05092
MRPERKPVARTRPAALSVPGTDLRSQLGTIAAEEQVERAGIDISEVQVQRARERVPQAEFIQVDATTASFDDASFDAVVSLYALIHIPLAEQPPLLHKVAAWLRPGGWLVATTGHRAWTGVDTNWLGGGTPMWWSHADAATNRAWMTQAGLTVEREEFVPEGEDGHALFWARRP